MHIDEVVIRSAPGREATANGDAAWVADGQQLLALCDGRPHGAPERDTASRVLAAFAAHESDLLTERAPEAADSSTRLRLGRTLELAFLTAHDELAAEAPDARAALAAVVVSGRHAHVAHVGNIRTYLLRDGRIRRLTADHTVAAERLRAGRMSRAEAEASDLRLKLRQALGGDHDVDVDLAGVALADGDQLLLCSDGLYDGLGEDVIARALAQHDLESAADRLLALAHDTADRSLVLATVRADTDAGLLDEIASVMASTFLFRDLSDGDRALVAPYLEHRFLAPDEVLFQEGDPGDTFFVVVDGTLRIHRGGVHLVDVTTGGHFGELCLARTATRSATVQAVGEALVFGLTRERFQQIVQRRPAIGARIALAALDQLGHRVRDLTRRLVGP